MSKSGKSNRFRFNAKKERASSPTESKQQFRQHMQEHLDNRELLRRIQSNGRKPSA